MKGIHKIDNFYFDSLILVYSALQSYLPFITLSYPLPLLLKVILKCVCMSHRARLSGMT